MPISYNYTHSALRLLTDAVNAWQSGSPETAAHLAGLSAECVLKSILIGLGVAATWPDGQIKGRPLRVHIDRLWSEFQVALQGHRGAAYIALLPTVTPHPFNGWLVDHRYVASAQLQQDELERWVWASIVMRSVLHLAQVNREAQ